MDRGLMAKWGVLSKDLKRSDVQLPQEQWQGLYGKIHQPAPTAADPNPAEEGKMLQMIDFPFSCLPQQKSAGFLSYQPTEVEELTTKPCTIPC